MTTRITHTVRIKHPSKDVGWYIDVEVLDAIITEGPNGEERFYDLSGHTAAATIIDNTTQGERNVAADAGDGATRVSHMEFIKNPSDPSQSLCVEVFDAITLETVNGEQICLQFDNDATNLESRATHKKKFMNKGDPSGSQFTTLTFTDAVTFSGPNDEQFMIESSGNGGTDDVTPDKDFPPKNKDTNPYIVFCNNKDTGKTTQGPWLGDALNSRGQPWQQGLLWWIKKIALDQPWYFYLKKQQPMEFSLDNSTHSNPKTDGIIWLRLPIISYVWAGAISDGPHFDVPKIGFNSLEDAIDQTAADIAAGLIDADQSYFVRFESTNKFTFTLTGIDFPDPDDPKAKPADMQKVAETFKDMWNDTSDRYNQLMQTPTTYPAFQPSDYLAFPTQPTSSFKLPLGNPSIPTAIGGIDDPHSLTDSFIAGVPPAYWLFAGHMQIFQPAYANYIEIAQLDPTKWDTTVLPPVRK